MAGSPPDAWSSKYTFSSASSSSSVSPVTCTMTSVGVIQKYFIYCCYKQRENRKYNLHVVRQQLLEETGTITLFFVYNIDKICLYMYTSNLKSSLVHIKLLIKIYIPYILT